MHPVPPDCRFRDRSRWHRRIEWSFLLGIGLPGTGDPRTDKRNGRGQRQPCTRYRPIAGFEIGVDGTGGLSGVSFWASAFRGRVIHALTNAMAAASDSHAPGTARLPVSRSESMAPAD